MPKSASSTDRVSESLAAIPKAADALFNHTTKAVSIREPTTRATERGSAERGGWMITASFHSFLEGCAFPFFEESDNGRLVVCTALLGRPLQEITRDAM